VHPHALRYRQAIVWLLVIIVSLAGPEAVAAVRRIDYTGTTSAPAPNRVLVKVVKLEGGRRVLRHVYMKMTLTCEDAATLVLRPGLRGGRLPEDGSFSLMYQDESIFIRMEGVIGRTTASGTAEFNWSRLTEDGQNSQLCTSGDLDWTATRVPEAIKQRRG